MGVEPKCMGRQMRFHVDEGVWILLFGHDLEPSSSKWESTGCRPVKIESKDEDFYHFGRHVLTCPIMRIFFPQLGGREDQSCHMAPWEMEILPWQGAKLTLYCKDTPWFSTDRTSVCIMTYSTRHKGFKSRQCSATTRVGTKLGAGTVFTMAAFFVCSFVSVNLARTPTSPLHQICIPLFCWLVCSFVLWLLPHL